MESTPSEKKWMRAASELKAICWDECEFKAELISLCRHEELAYVVWAVFREKSLSWASEPVEVFDGLTLTYILRRVGYAAVKGYLAGLSPAKMIILKS
jgi:hypothetical protein